MVRPMPSLSLEPNNQIAMLLADFNQEQALRRADASRRWLSRLGLLVAIIILVFTGLAFYHHYKPLPPGLDQSSPTHIVNESDLSFYFDHQAAFDQLLTYIDSAEQYILLDSYIFNTWSGVAGGVESIKRLNERLLAKKSSHPDIRIDLIVDPYNLGYGAFDSEVLANLSAAGVNVIITDLSQLRDANPLYGAWYRAFVAWWDFLPHYPWLANPWSAAGPKLTLRAYLAGLKLQANHRQLFIADNQGQLVSLTGLNLATTKLVAPAIGLRSALAEDIYQSEKAIAGFSHGSLHSLPANLLSQISPEDNRYAQVQLLTETQIKSAALTQINAVSAGDNLKLATRFLTDQDLLTALVKASNRGVKVEILLSDHQASALAYKQLLAADSDFLTVKFSALADLSGFFMLAEHPSDHQLLVINGSGTLNRHSLESYNLHSALALTLNSDWTLAPSLLNHFQSLWLSGSDYNSKQLPSWLTIKVIGLQAFTGWGDF